LRSPAIHDMTCHFFIYVAPGATRRNWNEKSESSSNFTSVFNSFPHQKRWRNTVPTRFYPATPLHLQLIR